MKKDSISEHFMENHNLFKILRNKSFQNIRGEKQALKIISTQDITTLGCNNQLYSQLFSYLH